MIRIGHPPSIKKEVQPYTLQEMSNQKINHDFLKEYPAANADFQTLKHNINKLKEEINVKKSMYIKIILV